MFSVGALQNQILAQLTQLTYGAITTVTNQGILSNTTKTAQKVSFHARQSVAASVPRSTDTSLSSDPPLGSHYKNANESLLDGVPLLPSWNSQTNPGSGFSRDVTSEILYSLSSSAYSALKQNLAPNQVENSQHLRNIWRRVLKITQQNIHNWDSSLAKAVIEDQKLMDLVKSCVQRRNVPRVDEEQRHVLSVGSLLNRPSYCSTGSFDSDRRFGPLNINLQPSLRYVPYRTFKTDRGTSAAEERNPSLFTRLKQKLFPPLLAPNAQAGGTPPGTLPMQQEKLKTLITDSSPDEANRIKVAFAEGYIAANPTPGTGTGESSNRTYRLLRTLQQVLAIAVFTAILASLMGSFGGGVFRVNVGNGNEVLPEDVNVTFDDVKGVDEAKGELIEVVDFLKNPEKYVQLGGKLPKGVLLVGPPGTGKTLLARAVAGEAGVPFFHAAGPEFDEILVGQGARRVRDLFKAAKVKAPCVIFIDEIDSVGAKRTNSVLHPYANQTINQLLSEMDGFRQNEGVIVLGATNRREDLDRALLRPGRFDVEVIVPVPEFKGRRDILEFYLNRVKKGDDLDIDTLARGTTGFTGADLENVVNQAALRAAVEGADRVTKKHLDFARDKVIMGPERKSKIPDAETNLITAYHEGGHAIVAHFTKDAHPLHKVTIISRGESLGHTAYIPEKERYHITRSQLMAMMDTMMGGRAAEELIFGADKITSGASSDLRQATAIATQMVKEWGMSDKVGLRAIEGSRRAATAASDLGPQTNEVIDLEIKRLLSESYERAKNILIKHTKEHIALAEALVKYETLDAEDVKALFAGDLSKKESKKAVPPSAPIPPNSTTPPTPNIGGFGIGKRPSPCP